MDFPQIIKFRTDINIDVTLTVDAFITATKDMIDFAINEKGYALDDLTVDFIAEDITGKVGNHGLSVDGLLIINNVLNDYKKGGIDFE